MTTNSNIDYSGQKDFYDPRVHRGSISVVGAGGIGSPTILGLARLGVPKIRVYDDDEVESRNVTNQFYELENIDQFKSEAITDLANQVTSNGEVIPHVGRIEPGHIFLGDIVISAVDSMESRKDIFHAAKKSPSVRWLIDGRLGGELIVVHVVNLTDNDHMEYYMSDHVMFDDSESESNSCTARAVIDVSYAVSAIIIRAVRNILSGKDTDKMITLNMGNLTMDVA